MMGYYGGGFNYAAGDYYQGDYYEGDFLGIGKAIKRLQPLKLIGKAVGLTPVGRAVSTVSAVARSLTSGGVKPMLPPPLVRTLPLAPGLVFGGPGPGRGRPEPGVSGMVHRMLPGGMTGYLPRRRLNPLNVKALRRAGRRLKGFLRIAHRLGALPVNRGKGKQLFKRKRRT